MAVPRVGATNGVTEPAFFAKETFIQYQRVVGVALIVLGTLTKSLTPVFKSISPTYAIPLFLTGHLLFSTSLFQQVIGNARGCSQGCIKRIIAGVAIASCDPFGWLVGGTFWHFSNLDNLPPAQAR